MAKEGTAPHTKADNDPFAPFTQIQQASFGGWLKLNAALFETMGEMGAEVADFVADRIKEDVKTQHQLLNCNDIEEARRIQEAFFRKAVDQYQAETGKLVKIGMSAFSAATDKADKDS